MQMQLLAGGKYCCMRSSLAFSYFFLCSRPRAGGAPDFKRQTGRPDPSADTKATLEGNRLVLDVESALAAVRPRPPAAPDMKRNLGRESVGVGSAAPTDPEGPLDWPNADPAPTRPRAWGALDFGLGGAQAGHEGFFREPPTGDLDAGVYFPAWTQADPSVPTARFGVAPSRFPAEDPESAPFLREGDNLLLFAPRRAPEPPKRLEQPFNRAEARWAAAPPGLPAVVRGASRFTLHPSRLLRPSRGLLLPFRDCCAALCSCLYPAPRQKHPQPN